jgi:hypothetical protein
MEHFCRRQKSLDLTPLMSITIEPLTWLCRDTCCHCECWNIAHHHRIGTYHTSVPNSGPGSHYNAITQPHIATNDNSLVMIKRSKRRGYVW